MNKQPAVTNMVMVAAMLLALQSIGQPTAWAQQSPLQTPEVTHTAVITTSLGTVTVELYGKDAPKTVRNFVELANRGFYNGQLVHRVIPGAIVQMGDPKTKDSTLRRQWGSGGESIYGGYFEDELNTMTPSYRRGYVEGALAMANRWPTPNSNTSQFFVMLTDNTKLPKPMKPVFTIFGKVTAGMDVLHAIGKMELVQGVPHLPVRLVEVKATPTQK